MELKTIFRRCVLSATIKRYRRNITERNGKLSEFPVPFGHCNVGKYCIYNIFSFRKRGLCFRTVAILILVVDHLARDVQEDVGVFFCHVCQFVRCRIHAIQPAPKNEEISVHIWCRNARDGTCQSLLLAPAESG